MKKIVFITLSALFIIIGATAQELQVEGDLEVVGTIDANNHRVKNVAEPVEDTDAVNSEFLRTSMRDDGPWEYKLIIVRINSLSTTQYRIEYKLHLESGGWNTDFPTFLNTLAGEGWILEKITTITPTNYTVDLALYTLKRRL